MEHLSNNLIRQVALSLPFGNIKDLCLTSHKFNNAVCKYQIFWYNKLVHDYGVTEEYSDTLDWKKIYEYYIHRLIGVGFNYSGELGLGQRIREVNELTDVSNIAVKYIACGGNNTIVIDINGDLWGTGFNNQGQLGPNIQGWVVYNFTKLNSESKFIQVACSGNHTLALSDDNEIWYWGKAPERFIYRDVPESYRHRNLTFELRISGHKAKQVACSDVSSAFIDLQGKLYTFGNRDAEGIGGSERLGYSSGSMANVEVGQVMIPNYKPIIQVSCGNHHTACIDSNNDIWIFGSNYYGQLGLGKEDDFKTTVPIKIPNHKAKFISCGSNNTAFIDLEDHVWMCGRNNGILDQQGDMIGTPQRITRVYYEGQIIDIDFRVKEVLCKNNITLFIDLEENLWVTGGNKNLNIDSKVPVMVPQIKASKVAAGNNHMAIIGYFK